MSPRFHFNSRLLVACSVLGVSVVANGEAKHKALEAVGIAAKVNGHVITKNEVSYLLTPKFKSLKKQFPDGGADFERLLTDAKKGIVQELIDRVVLIEQFDHLGIEIAPKAVEDEMKREIRENHNGNPGELRAALKASRMTVDRFRTFLRDRLLESEIKKKIIEKE